MLIDNAKFDYGDDELYKAGYRYSLRDDSGETDYVSDNRSKLKSIMRNKGISGVITEILPTRKQIRNNPTEKLKRSDFSYTYSPYGYMILYKNKPIGGAGTMRKKPMHWKYKEANLKEFRKIAEITIENILQGKAERFYDEIDKINLKSNPYLIKRNPFFLPLLAAIPWWGWTIAGTLGLYGVSKLVKFQIPIVGPILDTVRGIGKAAPLILGGIATHAAGKYLVPEEQKGIKLAANVATLGLVGFGIWQMVGTGTGIMAKAEQKPEEKVPLTLPAPQPV